MTRRFRNGFLFFIAHNLLSTHLFLDCGLYAVFGRDFYAHDIAQQNDSAQIRCLCYNAVTMQYQLRFANNNNNDNDDNPIIVERSFAG